MSQRPALAPLPESVKATRRALRSREWMSFAAWARDRGFPPDAAYKAMQRWAQRKEGTPIGVQTTAILAQLREDLSK